MRLAQQVPYYRRDTEENQKQVWELVMESYDDIVYNLGTPAVTPYK